jgi:TonB family protein
MPTCFLKRGLPFILTLAIGLLLWSLLGTGSLRSARFASHHQTGFADGSGAGWSGRVGRDSEDSRPFTPRDVEQKARILSRAEPQYTEEARENMVSGTVVLRAVFSASGEVTDIRVMSGLPYGLTEKSIEAARQIKFTPAMKDGRAVSQYIQIEYNFQLY